MKRWQLMKTQRGRDRETEREGKKLKIIIIIIICKSEQRRPVRGWYMVWCALARALTTTGQGMAH